MLCVPLRTKLLSGLQLDLKLSLHTIKGQTDNRIQMGAQKMICNTIDAGAAGMQVNN